MGVLFSIFLSDDAATTRFGASLAHHLAAGDVVLLEGEIGAGKTHFARALVQARLASEGLDRVEVPSPTFTLIQTYDLRDCQIWHADLYRLGDPSELVELGLDTAFENGICLIEWPDRLDMLPDNALTLRFETDGDGRRVTAKATADRWASLTKAIEVQDE